MHAVSPRYSRAHVPQDARLYERRNAGIWKVQQSKPWLGRWKWDTQWLGQGPELEQGSAYNHVYEDIYGTAWRKRRDIVGAHGSARTQVRETAEQQHERSQLLDGSIEWSIHDTETRCAQRYILCVSLPGLALFMVEATTKRQGINSRNNAAANTQPSPLRLKHQSW